MKNLTLLIAVFVSFALHAQNPTQIKGKTMTSVELYLALNNYHQNHEGTQGLEFVDCTFTQVTDDLNIIRLLDNRYAEGSHDPFNPTLKSELGYALRFNRCHFNPNENQAISFNSLYFLSIAFDNCDGYGVEFDNCIGYSDTDFIDINFKYLKFIDGRFFERINFNDAKVEQLSFETCAFVGNTRSLTFGFAFENRNVFSYFDIADSEFIDSSEGSERYKKFDNLIGEKGILRFQRFDAVRFSAVHNYFDCTLVLDDFTVEKYFEFENRLLREIVFQSVPGLPAESSKMPYSQFLHDEERMIRKGDLRTDENRNLKNKIGIMVPAPNEEYQFIRFESEADYKDDFQTPWTNRDPEKRIIPVYSRLQAIYGANKDVESYNRCFNDLKEIEKTSSKVKYQVNGKFEDLFRWKMDQFLQSYSAYGTDPILSLINGFWTILLFALIYCVFPSEEDNLRFHNITAAFRRYISHFGKGEKAFFTPDELYEQDVKDIVALREDITLYKEQMPPVIRIFGGPVYFISRFMARVKHRVRQLLFFNVYDDWRTLAPKGKAKTTLVLTTGLVIFALWGLFMRCLNSFALSMNAFVTLGYGEIEAKGVARYFCVLEGIVGWFLLSIFSVSLISQILQ